MEQALQRRHVDRRAVLAPRQPLSLCPECLGLGNDLLTSFPEHLHGRLRGHPDHPGGVELGVVLDLPLQPVLEGERPVSGQAFRSKAKFGPWEGEPLRGSLRAQA